MVLTGRNYTRVEGGLLRRKCSLNNDEAMGLASSWWWVGGATRRCKKRGKKKAGAKMKKKEEGGGGGGQRVAGKNLLVPGKSVGLFGFPLCH